VSKTWLVVSTGQQVAVAGPEVLATWWAALAPQIPGTSRGPLAEAAGAAALVLPDGITARDTRLQINAHLHGEHLRSGTLSVHGVAVAKDDQAVVLLGAHGAGKSLTALALVTALGWRPIAGDTCLIRCDPCRRGVGVVGGTRSYVVRRGAASRWFPGLVLASGDAGRVELCGHLEPWWSAAGPAGTMLAAIGIVRVEAGIDRTGLVCVPCDAQTARNAIYRASSHLIDKIPDDPHADPLRLVETPGLARDRVQLARRAAASTRCWLLRGSPHAMAAEIDRVTGNGGASR
jgi:hypothetical protein